jgi:hypothetical protein
MFALSAHIMALVPKITFSTKRTIHRAVKPVFQYRRTQLITNKLMSRMEQIKQKIGKSG